jgi:translation initiation factor IF-2
MSVEKATRLFKIAKELNVGTALLVDTLHGKGYKEITNDPNTKLSTEQVDVLLKEFSSDKILKDKADKVNEKRKEELRASGISREPGEEPVVEDSDQSKVTPNDLKNRMRRPVPQAPRADAPPVSPQVPPSTPPPAEVKEEPVVKPVQVTPPPAPEPVVVNEAPTPKVEPAPPQPEISTPVIELKVVGKIDLDQVNKPKSHPVQPPVTPPAVQPPVAPQPVVQQPPVAPKVEPPLVEKPKVVTPPSVVKPVQTTPKSEPVVSPPSAKTEQKVEEKAKPQEVRPPLPSEDETIRVQDNTPQLRGLKVLDKIDLSPRKKQSEDKSAGSNTGGGSTPSAPGTTAEGDKDEKSAKKRRRKRKRKSSEAAPGTPATADDKKKVQSSTTAAPAANSAAKKPKEKISEKDVDTNIRSTMGRMNQGASRKGQMQRRDKRRAYEQQREADELQAEMESKVLELTEFITANEFANLINVSVTDIITKTFQLGNMISINQRLEADLLAVLAEEYGYEVRFVDVTETEEEDETDEVDESELVTRQPIITVMGHVDHGKTTLLDYLRKSNVTSHEAGGITQHIGAYEVKLKSGETVTFLDTPGHEAFTAMRARGAKVTDVAIIVIAADDAVMPQTREAINHAQAAGVPMVFALNKVDKPGANSERIRTQLSEMNILVEDWGGKFQSQEISALKGMGVDELLEKVILEAEMLELKAAPTRPATGTVIEARLDRGRGNVVTMLVQNGTLRVGDELVAGIHYGKVRALTDQNGKRVDSAGPGEPVQVLGIDGLPTAGDNFKVYTEDGKARTISQRRTELYREQQLRQNKHLTLEEITRRRAIGNFQELNLIIRADVDGSAEALSGSLLKLSTEEVKVNIIQKGLGAITEADINLAIASDAIVIAFNVRPNAQARTLAEREQIDIRTYSIIYQAIDDVRDALSGLLSPEIKEETFATLEVLQIFKIHRVGNVAGCLVSSGKISRTDRVRVIRDAIVIYDGTLSTLKRYKDDVKEAISGQECGLTIDGFADLKEGDQIEAYRRKEIRRTL